VYATTGADNNVHLYGLNLSDASVQPAPQQIGSLSLASTDLICDSSSAETNLLQPTSLFVLLHLAGTNGLCGTNTTTGDQWVLVNYTDSATTAPTVLSSAPTSITSTDITALYAANGTLSGIVLLDPATSNLYFYTSQAFTTPKLLAAGVSMIDRLDDIETVQSANQFSSSLLWLGVTIASTEYLYQITNNGNATSVYTAKGTLTAGYNGGVDDNSNIYLTDTYESPLGQQAYVLSASLTGGGANILYLTAAAAPVPQLVGSNGSVLVYFTQNVSASSTATFWTLNANVAGSPTQLGATLNGSIESARMYAPVSAGPGSRSLFVTVRAESNSNPPVVTYSTEVLNLTSGNTAQPLLANSVFLDKATALSGTQLQIKGITDTNGGEGGGTIYNVSIGNLAAQALMTAGGAPFTVPAGDATYFLGESTFIGVGELYNSPTGGTTYTGLAYDLSQLLVVPVTVPNANVTAAF